MDLSIFKNLITVFLIFVSGQKPTRFTDPTRPMAGLILIVHINPKSDLNRSFSLYIYMYSALSSAAHCSPVSFLSTLLESLSLSSFLELSSSSMAISSPDESFVSFSKTKHYYTSLLRSKHHSCLSLVLNHGLGEKNGIPTSDTYRCLS